MHAWVRARPWPADWRNQNLHTGLFVLGPIGAHHSVAGQRRLRGAFGTLRQDRLKPDGQAVQVKVARITAKRDRSPAGGLSGGVCVHHIPAWLSVTSWHRTERSGSSGSCSVCMAVITRGHGGCTADGC